MVITTFCWGHGGEVYSALSVDCCVSSDTPFSDRQLMIFAGQYSDSSVREICHRAAGFFPCVTVTPYVNANGIPSRVVVCACQKVTDVRYNLHLNEVEGYFDFKLVDGEGVSRHVFASRMIDDSLAKQVSTAELESSVRPSVVLLPAEPCGDVWEFARPVIDGQNTGQLGTEHLTMICSKSVAVDSEVRTDTDGNASANVGASFESRNDDRSLSVSGNVGIERDASGRVHGEAEVSARAEIHY